MLIPLPVLVVCGVSILLVGFILGYGIRAGISRRHRAQARRRYEMTGSSWLTAAVSEDAASSFLRAAPVGTAHVESWPAKQLDGYDHPTRVFS